MLTKKSFLLTIFLTIAMVLSFSVAFAKSEKAGGNVSVAGNATSSVVSNATTTPKNQGQVTAAEHRSVVANFVQSIVHVADREGGIGQQVRVVAQQQNQSEATTTEAINKIESRSKIKTFLIGSDYKNLGALRSEMVQTRNRLAQLTNFMGKVKNASSTEEMQLQIQTLEQEQTKIETFIKAQEGKFSLFGWLLKLFNK
jgi:hypothetical protein